MGSDVPSVRGADAPASTPGPARCHWGRSADRLQVHRASVTNVIDRLVDQGLVERRPHDSDRRTVMAAITPHGREVARAASEVSQRRPLRHERARRRRLRGARRPAASRCGATPATTRTSGLHHHARLMIGGLPTIGWPRMLEAATRRGRRRSTVGRDAYAATPERDVPFTTISGQPVRPLYTDADLPPSDAIGLPGGYPFTRGVYPSMYRGRLWTMRQFAGYGTAAETNARFHYLLAHGQTGLSTAFDMPSLMGYDSIIRGRSARSDARASPSTASATWRICSPGSTSARSASR